MTRKKNPNDGFFEGKSLGQVLGEGLQEFASALNVDAKKIPRDFKCHIMSLDLHPTRYTPELVKQTRQALGASQDVFAQFLGVSRTTVRAWEQGAHPPQDSACRFMDEIRANPTYFRERMKSMAVKKTTAHV